MCDLFVWAAAHLSAVDYLGDVPWNDHAEAKDWYARVKSRPSFRQLLEDNNLAKTDREAFVGTIRKNSEHLLGLINEILDISKIESGRFVLQKEHCERQPSEICVIAINLF